MKGSIGSRSIQTCGDFVELDGTGRWRAKAIGEIDGHPLDAHGSDDLDLAAREAAEHFTGRTLR